MELFYPAKARLPTHKQRHHVRDCDRDLAVETVYLARVRSPIAVEELRIPMSALLTLQPRFPFGGLTISRCVDALTRQDLLDPLPYVRRHICGDWGDVRAEHRCYNDAALKLGGYLLSSYVISDGLDLCVFTEADRNRTAVAVGESCYVLPQGSLLACRREFFPSPCFQPLCINAQQSCDPIELRVRDTTRKPIGQPLRADLQK